jgi:hypothetical protein
MAGAFDRDITNAEAEAFRKKAADDATAKAAADKAAADAAAAAKKKADQAAILAAGEAAAQKAGLTLAIVNAYPELKEAWALYLSGDTSKAFEVLKATPFYQAHSGTAFENIKVKIEQSALYEQKINEYKAQLKAIAIASGRKVTDADIDAVAREAWDKGLNPNDLTTKSMLQSHFGDIIGGRALDAVNTLKQYGLDNGISRSDSWYQNAANSIANGESTINTWQDILKADAISKYPMYAEQINSGQTVRDVLSPYMSSMQNILEIPMGSVNLNDPTLNMATRGKLDDKNNPTAMSLYDFEIALKKDERWGFTKNARASLDSVGRDIATSLGVAY